MLCDKVNVRLLNGEVISRNLHTWNGVTFLVSYNGRRFEVREFCGTWYEIPYAKPFEHLMQADNREEYEQLIEYAVDLGYEIIKRDCNIYGIVRTHLKKGTTDEMRIDIAEEKFN